jgi:phytoene desaturase
VSQHILIIGAGIGGLATAIRLAHAGYRVEIWEKNQTSGGKAQELRKEGFRWDLGPSLLTMPHLIRDLFALCGRPLERYLELDRLPNTCRYFWPDGHQIDENAQFFKEPQVLKFMRYAEGLYELSEHTYLSHPPDRWLQNLHWHHLPRMRHLPKMLTFQSLAQKINHYFQDPHLRQLFYRYATYNGSSPFLTPASFNIIPYVESRFGAWYPRGGMARIPEALTRLATEIGVEIHYGRNVARFRKGTITSFQGHSITPDIIISNADILDSKHTWLREHTPCSEHTDIISKELSSSAYILLLGVRDIDSRLDHHNIFFSDDYGKEFHEIFDLKQLPTNPTLYLSITSRSDADDAPKGHENYFILANTPSTAGLYTSKESLQQYDQHLIERLEDSFGFKNLSKRIVIHERLTPLDFATRDRAHLGSLYGWASHSISASLFRPPIHDPNIPNLFYVGGTTHPGGGIPMVILGSKMTAERVIELFPKD